MHVAESAVLVLPRQSASRKKWRFFARGTVSPKARPCFTTCTRPVPARRDRTCHTEWDAPPTGECGGAGLCPRTPPGEIVDTLGCAAGECETGHGIGTILNQRRCGLCSAMGALGIWFWSLSVVSLFWRLGRRETSKRPNPTPQTLSPAARTLQGVGYGVWWIYGGSGRLPPCTEVDLRPGEQEQRQNHESPFGHGRNPSAQIASIVDVIVVRIAGA